MEKNLQWYLDTSEELWRHWVQSGIKPGTEFIVDFNFYCAKKEMADALASSMEKAGFSLKVMPVRTLVLWKGWEVTASAKHSWTKEYIQERIREFYGSAQSCGFSFEGVGAQMP